MSVATELTRLGAAELARGIAAREFSSSEAVGAFVERQQALQPKLNAVAISLHDQALAAARAADKDGASEDRPLHGVPVTVKECFDTVGAATTAGLVGRASKLKTDDAELVMKLREAGAILTAKSNLAQLELFLEADNPLYGRTNNPWDVERTPGGSSGGEAALVAAGGSPLGLGTDIGGSIRVPAHFCGVCGLRPTPGRLSMAGTFDIDLFGHVLIPDAAGPIARTVSDLKLAMRVLGSPVEEAKVRGLVVGIYDHDGYFEASAAVRRAAHQAAAVLESAGARVVPFEPPRVQEALDVFYGLFTADGADGFKAVLAGEHLDSRIRALLQLATMAAWMRPAVGAALMAAGQRRLAHLVTTNGKRSAEGTRALVARRDAYRKRFDAALASAGADVILCPPNSLPAFKHGASGDLGPAGNCYTALYNVLAWPAGVVPVTRVRPTEVDRRKPGGDRMEAVARSVDEGSAGLPVGVQVAARPQRDDLVMAVMAAIEAGLRGSVDYPAIPPKL